MVRIIEYVCIDNSVLKCEYGMKVKAVTVLA